MRACSLHVRNSFMILTSSSMTTLPETILVYASDSPEGSVLSPKEFLHAGSRPAIDQALSRLAREGRLIRVDRGAYVAPVKDGTGYRSPSIEKVVESLAKLSGEIIVPDGAASAAILSLASRLSTAPAYVTSGRSRRLLVGSDEVILTHAPNWMLSMSNRPAGTAVRALAWLGVENVSEALDKLRRSLSSCDWMMLVTCRAALPSWMARAIGEEVASESHARPRTPGPLRGEVPSLISPEGTLNRDSATAFEALINQSVGSA